MNDPSPPASPGVHFNWLIVLAGLPGVGKSTVARKLAEKLPAVHVRIDTIEQALLGLDSRDRRIGPAGYIIGYAVARDNLQRGLSVVADSVNPLGVTRDAWRAVASQSQCQVLEVELICSDPAEHRRRVESRTPDITGHRLPSWEEVTQRVCEPWDREHVVLDTARLPALELVDAILGLIRPVHGPAA